MLRYKEIETLKHQFSIFMIYRWPPLAASCVNCLITWWSPPITHWVPGWDIKISRYWNVEISRYWDIGILINWDFENSDQLVAWSPDDHLQSPALLPLSDIIVHIEILSYWDIELLRYWDIHIFVCSQLCELWSAGCLITWWSPSSNQPLSCHCPTLLCIVQHYCPPCNCQPSYWSAQTAESKFHLGWRTQLVDYKQKHRWQDIWRNYE